MLHESYIRKSIIVVSIAAVIALLAYTYYAISQARYLTHMPVSIQVVGEGEIFAKPDIATFSFAVHAEDKDAAGAQSRSADSVNAILGSLKAAGIEEKDIKTDYYNLNPRYEYPQVECAKGYCPPQTGERTLVGYEVSQGMTVKVRTTEDVGSLIAKVGELGATDVSGPTFTIDDDSALKAEAREKAIADARVKAEKLARDLDVTIIRMNSYWEDEGGYPMPYEKSMTLQSVAGAGDNSAPQIPTGENTITSRVNISYEVR